MGGMFDISQMTRAREQDATWSAGRAFHDAAKRLWPKCKCYVSGVSVDHATQGVRISRLRITDDGVEVACYADTTSAKITADLKRLYESDEWQASVRRDAAIVCADRYRAAAVHDREAASERRKKAVSKKTHVCSTVRRIRSYVWAARGRV